MTEAELRQRKREAMTETERLLWDHFYALDKKVRALENNPIPPVPASRVFENVAIGLREEILNNLEQVFANYIKRLKDDGVRIVSDDPVEQFRAEWEGNTAPITPWSKDRAD